MRFELRSMKKDALNYLSRPKEQRTNDPTVTSIIPSANKA